VAPEQVRQVLDEVAAFGQRNDAQVTERERRMLNITPATGQFLAILVRSLRARRVLEVGTSNGYSTLWLAWAAHDTGGHVDTIDAATDKLEMARANLERAGLAEQVTLRHGRALQVLAQLEPGYDLIFLDADRSSYLDYLETLLRLVRPGGLMVTDNVTSHAHQLTDFLARLESDTRVDSVTIPIGNGEELTYRRE